MAPTPCTEWDVRALGNHLIAGAWRIAGGEPEAVAGRDHMAGDRVAAYREATDASLARVSEVLSPTVLCGRLASTEGRGTVRLSDQLQTGFSVWHMKGRRGRA